MYNIYKLTQLLPSPDLRMIQVRIASQDPSTSPAAASRQATVPPSRLLAAWVSPFSKVTEMLFSTFRPFTFTTSG